MALHPKSDFAKLCGLTTGNLTNYITRKKVVLSGDFIDDSIYPNNDFLAKRRKRLQEEAGIGADQPAARDDKPERKLRYLRPDPGLPEPPNVREPSFDNGPEDEDDDGSDQDFAGYSKSMSVLNKKKLIVEIQKKQREIALLRLREEKLNAIVIPTELVKVIFTQHSRTLATEFKNSVESILTLITQEAALSGPQTAKLRGKLLDEINSAMERSVTEGKKNIANIQREFIEKKEVGERG